MSNIDLTCLGVNKRGGKRDDKIHALCDAFGVSKEALYHWRRGKYGVERQRLFYLLYTTKYETIDLLVDGIKERVQ